MPGENKYLLARTATQVQYAWLRRQGGQPPNRVPGGLVAARTLAGNVAVQFEKSVKVHLDTVHVTALPKRAGVHWITRRSPALSACGSLGKLEVYLKHCEIRQVGVKVEVEVSAFASARNGDIRAHEANGEGGKVRRVYPVVTVQIAEQPTLGSQRR